MNYSISNENIQGYNENTPHNFPKYTSQLINLANQNAQGTRPAVVGQMSELFTEFMETSEEITIENWESWYSERYPDASEKAVQRIYDHVLNLKNAISQITPQMINEWVEDLIIQKTFNGLYVQKAILHSLSEKRGLPYRLATPEEESIGIDGYVGDTPYSIKPDTYKTMEHLPETINVKMIYYTKTKTGLKIEVED